MIIIRNCGSLINKSVEYIMMVTEMLFRMCCPVERYDPRQNKWTLVAPMSTRRKHLGCAVYNNWIYAVGGRDDATELSSAERYNPHTNTWSPIVAMSSRRSGVSWFHSHFFFHKYLQRISEEHP